MKMLIRKDIANLTSYKAGKPIEEVKRAFRLKQVIKLASNENPLSVSQKAQAAIKRAIPQLNRYPETSGFYVRKALAAKLKLNPDMFVLGNGSDELIDIIIKTFVEKDENIITADITFLEYKIIAQILGRKVITVPLKNFVFDLEAVANKINKKTKLIFIANPNNPTGTYVNKERLDSFIKGLGRSVILVLDEAYDNFIDVEDFPQSRDYLKRGNIIILKTFSKSYALAGARIGYAICPLYLTQCLQKVKPPFNVNSLAQAGAVASLKDEAHLRKSRQIVLEGKDYLYQELDKMGLRYIPTVANFILIDVSPVRSPRHGIWRGSRPGRLTSNGVRKSGSLLCKKMQRLGIIARDMDQYGLKNFIRVTIGRPLENRKFIKALKKVLNI